MCLVVEVAGPGVAVVVLEVDLHVALVGGVVPLRVVHVGVGGGALVLVAWYMLEPTL